MSRRVCAGLLLVILLSMGVALPQGGRAAQPEPVKSFDLTISLEWDPGRADSLPADLAAAGCTPAALKEHFLDDLSAGIYELAGYLYYFSEGRLALGNVSIFTGGEQWQEADIRILADNSFRPAANVGGIVGQPLIYTRDNREAITIFYPGSVLLSRLWNGSGGRCGAWSDAPGWRTIGHEFAHYALFLYDEYFNIDTGRSQYCTTTGLTFGWTAPTRGSLSDSIMAYQYSADKLWLGGMPAPEPGPPPLWCDQTPQVFVHQEPDWETVDYFYGTGLPTALRSDLQFAGSPAESMLRINIVPPAVFEQNGTAVVAVDSPSLPRPVVRSYLLRHDDGGEVRRVLGQGEQVVGRDLLPFWGVHASTKDRALLLLQDLMTAERYAYPPAGGATAPLDVTNLNRYDLRPSTWQPSLTVTPQVFVRGPLSEVGALDVTLTDCAARTKSVELRYCPAGGDCGAPVVISGGPVFSHTFRFPLDGVDEPPSSHGYIYARSLDTLEETAVTYQLAGGVGPAIIDGHAPLVDGQVSTDAPLSAGVVPRDSRVLYSSTQVCTVGDTLPPEVLGFAGTPINVQPVVATENGGYGWGANSSNPEPPLRVRLSYSEDLLKQLDLSEQQLVVLHLDPEKRNWTLVQDVERNNELNYISVNRMPFAGGGQTFVLAYVSAKIYIPVVER